MKGHVKDDDEWFVSTLVHVTLVFLVQSSRIGCRCYRFQLFLRNNNKLFTESAASCSQLRLEH
jgi:hypothetical protein